MKYFFLLASLICSAKAFAVSECTGRASDNTWVTVHINTTGATGIPESGEVTFENEENKFGYRFTKEEITQFFEYDEPANNSAIVGLAAYAEKEFPISIKYNGPNFVDMDQKSVIEDGKTQPIKNNFLRVWKGPGHSATDQIQLNDIACSVWSNI
ncbi:hypothetical protein [Bdellovibrio sp. HCB-162]|uniref:hypothetical protein n=1 Tax=Bdellovibrio sp. HCB-162 TaxID=3394234 RepID=UPI0039BD7A4E